jgi:putative transcriptional regulator
MPAKPSFFESVKSGLEEAISHARGEITLKQTIIPDDPPSIDGHTLQQLRQQTGMSQAVFAKMLSVSTKTIQSWEQGARQPSGASLRLLQIFAQNPSEVCQTLGMPIIKLTGISTKQKKGKQHLVVTH